VRRGCGEEEEAERDGYRGVTAERERGAPE
jgi:hypothetical protein